MKRNLTWVGLAVLAGLAYWILRPTKPFVAQLPSSPIGTKMISEAELHTALDKCGKLLVALQQNGWKVNHKKVTFDMMQLPGQEKAQGGRFATDPRDPCICIPEQSPEYQNE